MWSVVPHPASTHASRSAGGDARPNHRLVNWRAIGCLGIGAAAFVGIGLLGMSFAFRAQPGCPDRLQWADRTYLAEGTPAPSPAFAKPGEPVPIGSTFIGLTTRQAYGPPGSSPSTQAEDRPETIALDCADGTYQTYAWDGISHSPLPTTSP